MPTRDGCRERIARFLAALGHPGPLLLGDPLHLRYFANCHVDPFSLGGDFGAFLLVRPDGTTVLVHDRRAPKSVDDAFADERIAVPWYDGQSPGVGPRRLAVRAELEKLGPDGRVHDAVLDPVAPHLHAVVAEMRRAKMPDEIDALKACMRATEAGHAWARASVRAGMTELDVYAGVFAACTTAAGKPVIVYGDFAVSPGSARRGGMATSRSLADGDTLILDFSVVLQGYRSDFTNTLVVGANPTPGQQRLFDLSVAAMTAGEAELKAGAKCQAVYDAVQGVFAAAGVADHFPHHAGHGVGLSHPETPFFVAKSEGDLVAGDVVTLEPGLYVDGVGGVRIEHNYLVTAGGFERLSRHAISLT